MVQKRFRVLIVGKLVFSIERFLFLSKVIRWITEPLGDIAAQSLQQFVSGRPMGQLRLR